MSASTSLEGGCTCGAVRYRLTRHPMFVNCCHCQTCQQQSGSAFAVNALIEASEFICFQGTTDMIDTPTESGKGQKVYRCPTCKAALWSNYAGADDKVNFVRVGTLDTPDRCPPNIHIFTRSKHPWVILPEDVPAVQAYYDAKDVWTAESLKRMHVAMS